MRQGVDFVQQSKLQQSAFQQTTNNLLTGFTLGSLAVSTPLFIPQGDSKSLSFNVLAAVPLAVQLAKAVKLRKFPTTPKFRQPIETDNFNLQPETPPFVPETTGTAYLLVELLDENGNFVREVDKYYVSSQDGFTKIGSADNVPIDFGEECQTSGFLRFSLVNEHNTQPAYFDDFEIVHKPNPQKLTLTSWAEYYAFGKVAKASFPANGAYRYGYQGKFAEKDGQTDWNSFELRQYDSDIARWCTLLQPMI